MMAGPGLRGCVGVPPSLAYRRHVLEFEEIYREEAKGRQKEAGKIYGEKHPKRFRVPHPEALETGQFRAFMARDASVSEQTVRGRARRRRRRGDS
jgi:hypothetical protein